MARATTALLVFSVVLTAIPAWAQTPPATTAPPLIPPKPAATTPAPAPTVPFPAEARVAYINMQNIFAESELGKKGVALLKTLNDRLSAGLAARDKEIQGLTEKLRTQQGIVNSQTAAGWGVSLQKLQREAQFAQQEAQVDVNQLQEELLSEFQARVRPVIEAIRSEKGLWIVFSIDNDSGGLSVATAHAGVDLSAEVTRRLNAVK